MLSLVGHIAAHREGAPWPDALRGYPAGNLAMVAARLGEEFPRLDWEPPQACCLARIDLRPLGADGDALQREPVEAEKAAVMPGAAYGSPGRVRLDAGCPRTQAEAGVEALVRTPHRLGRAGRRTRPDDSYR